MTTSRKRTAWRTLTRRKRTRRHSPRRSRVTGVRFKSTQDQLSNTADRIAVVKKSTAELDDSVAKAPEIRQKQHAEFVTLTANNAAATELLKLAINRLNKFYARFARWDASYRRQEKHAMDRLYKLDIQA